MKKSLLLLLLITTIQLYAAGEIVELDQMAGRKVEVTYRFYNKSISGTLKGASTDGVILFVENNRKVFIFYEAIASIKELYIPKSE